MAVGVGSRPSSRTTSRMAPITAHICCDSGCFELRWRVSISEATPGLPSFGSPMASKSKPNEDQVRQLMKEARSAVPPGAAGMPVKHAARVLDRYLTALPAAQACDYSQRLE